MPDPIRFWSPPSQFKSPPDFQYLQALSAHVNTCGLVWCKIRVTTLLIRVLGIYKHRLVKFELVDGQFIDLTEVFEERREEQCRLERWREFEGRL